jgi:lysophospholipase L1-like esterase
MKIQLLYLLSFFTTVVHSQERTFRFDFGTEKSAQGYTAVTPNTVFSAKTGYGFSHQSTPVAVRRKGDPLEGTYITSGKPIYFSVVLPEGNYDIKVLLGDTKGISSTIIRAECRRLMSGQTITSKGEIVAKEFSIHLRDSMIRNAEGNVVSKVRLKSRESAFLHWDNLLTLEFNDSLPKICGLEIKPNLYSPTIFLAGNSTVVDQDKEPWAAWGQMFPVMIAPGKAIVANYAESGEAMRSFKGANRLEKIWSMAKPGDYLFIEFAHNDQKPGGSHLDPFTTYMSTLKSWIAEARQRSMIPVLVTSMHRRNFDAAGKIVNTLLDYPDAMRKTAADGKVLLIDLNAMSKELYEAWGAEKSLKAFVHFPANTFPGQDRKLEDNTHFSTYGAYELAKCVAAGLAASSSTLKSIIHPDFQQYNPSQPLPFDKFYLPMGSLIAAIKPDGN